MCNFPAVQLLQERRRIAKAAETSNDFGVIRASAEFVKATDDLRFSHQELTGCICWEEAVKANPA